MSTVKNAALRELAASGICHSKVRYCMHKATQQLPCVRFFKIKLCAIAETVATVCCQNC